MKIPLLCFVLLATLIPGFAQETFPGLKAILSAAEWKRAGLDRLTPDEIGVIDAALIRRDAGLKAQHQADLMIVREEATTTSAATKNAPGILARFGLPVDGPNWRDLPVLKAKVVKWETSNRFVLDNGQVWEGFEPITYELLGKEIEIQPRPNGHFALAVNGVNTTIRVIRLR